MQADLLADLRAAVDKAIADGTTYQQFRKEFKQIVAQRGWTGWTGQGTKAGEAWRTRVIYDTNLFTSYSAGRFKQMKEVANICPYWRYRHSPASTDPRPEHVAWDGLILKHDDPWWSSHTPPNGFGCKCYIETLAERDMKKQGLTVTDKGKIPFPNSGVDKGWVARLEKMKEDKLRRLGLSGDTGTMPAFIRSSTVQQAEQEALKLGVKSADYRQHLDIANEVNTALEDLQQRGLVMPDHVKIDDQFFLRWAQQLGAKADEFPAAFVNSRQTGETYLFANPLYNYWNQLAQDASQQHHRGEWSTAHEHHAIRHEIGHLLFYRANPARYAAMRSQQLTGGDLQTAHKVSLFRVAG